MRGEGRAAFAQSASAPQGPRRAKGRETPFSLWVELSNRQDKTTPYHYRILERPPS